MDQFFEAGHMFLHAGRHNSGVKGVIHNGTQNRGGGGKIQSRGVQSTGIAV
jgi:hypothetical protein